MNNLIEVGIITKPHGFKGQMKVKPLDFGKFNFKSAKCLFVDGIPFEIENITSQKENFLVKFKEINSIDIANKFKNKSVYVKRDLINLNDEYFCADLLGLNLVTEDNVVLGKIEDIQNFGSADVFYITSNKPFLFSNVGGIIKSVNFDEKKVIINKKKLEEVMVYEDWHFNIISRNVWTFKAKFNR